MKRRVLTILSALSLLLFVAVCVLWVRSYWVHYSVDVVHKGELDARERWSGWSLAATSHTGHVSIRLSRFTEADAGWYGAARPLALGFAMMRWTSPIDGGGWGNPSFGLRRGESNADNVRIATVVLFVPHWCLTAALAFAPILWLALRRARGRRARSHLCPACGYDLRATPDQCPECGAITPQSDLAAGKGTSS